MSAPSVFARLPHALICDLSGEVVTVNYLTRASLVPERGTDLFLWKHAECHGYFCVIVVTHQKWEGT